MAVFEASPEGFRSQQLGRPAPHLVRELIQNVLDEAASVCRVEIKHTPKKGVFMRVSDDVMGGIRDESLIFTIWASDKQDNPTKRGRMGRGLKEVVSVSDWTSVATQGRKTTLFERSKEGEWSRKTTGSIPSPDYGTVVEAQVRAWTAKDAQDIVAYLRRIRPPSGLKLVVNDEEVKRKPILESFEMWLPSVTYVVEDGERKTSNRSFLTTVQLFSEEEHWVYEMGLPVEPVDFPLSIDVGQRIPLREQRDTLLTWYKSELFAKLISERIQYLPIESLRDNYILEGAKADNYLSQSAKEKIALAWTEGKPFATSPQMMSIATGQHIQVVNLRTLPEAVRDIVKMVGQDVKVTLRERQAEFCPIEEATPTQQRLIDCWEYIAEGVHRPCTVAVASGRPGASASFSRENSRLTIYHEVVGEDFFTKPLKTEQLATLIHELSHWKSLEDSHGVDFHSDAEYVGAEIAVFILENYYEVCKRGGI